MNRKTFAIPTDICPYEAVKLFDKTFSKTPGFIDEENQALLKEKNETLEEYRIRINEFPLILSGFSAISWIVATPLGDMANDGTLHLFLDSQPLLHEHLKNNCGFETVLWEQTMGTEHSREQNEFFMKNLLKAHPNLDINSHHLYLPEYSDAWIPYHFKALKSETALHAAFYDGAKDNVIFLLEYGATLEGNTDNPGIKLGFIPNLEMMNLLYEVTNFNYLNLLDEKYQKQRSYAPFFDIRNNLELSYAPEEVELLKEKIALIHQKENLDPTVDWIGNTILNVDFLNKIKAPNATYKLRLNFTIDALKNNPKIFHSSIAGTSNTVEYYIQKIISETNNQDLQHIYKEFLISKALQEKIKTPKKMGRF